MTRAAWSCYTRIDDLHEDGGCGDVLGRAYAYDSKVVNHRQVAVGDLLVMRDGHLVYGYGVVEEILTAPDTKTMHRCPRCRSAGVGARSTLTPRFRCHGCGHLFDATVPDEVPVTTYSALYESWWAPFGSPAPVRALGPVYAGRDRQNAIRRLDIDAAQAMLRYHSGVEGNLTLELLTHEEQIAGGHVDVLAKQRIGQRQYRERLLERFGSTCAVTGDQPDAVLDAAHLYSYAERPVHDDDGGLLLRADVHRLFDRLLLTFDPVTWQSRVAPVLLERHERMHALDSVPIALPGILRPNRDLIQRHHDAARARWRDIA